MLHQSLIFANIMVQGIGVYTFNTVPCFETNSFRSCGAQWLTCPVVFPHVFKYFPRAMF